MIAMAPPRPSRPAAPPQPAPSQQARPPAVPSAEAPAMANLDGQPRHWRVRLTPNRRAAAEAREHIRAAISAWRIPVDMDVAVLLASELVTNAITHGQPANGRREPGDSGPAAGRPVSAEPIMLSIRCYRGELRVEVHDRSGATPPPSPEHAPAESETGRGLMLVAALAAKWGYYRTPAGKAVFFTLIPPPDNSVPPTGLPKRGDGEP
jgi:anti-sigma regulatory factor (Ser/Thr protein kinase)